MQYWQYRVGYRTYEQKNGVTGREYGIVEAFFNDKDELQFVTSEFQYPYGEDLDDVLNDLDYFKQAGELPPIDLDNVKFAGFTDYIFSIDDVLPKDTTSNTQITDTGETQ